VCPQPTCAPASAIPVTRPSEATAAATAPSGDDVVLAELVLAHDAGERVGGRHLHLLGDLSRAHVEGAAEHPGNQSTLLIWSG
jgi:hypothetical protein